MAADKSARQPLKDVLAQIRKEVSEDAIMQMSEGTGHDVEGISTGSLSLDLALGGKGLPRGRIIEVYGPESSGKTTVALHALANAQKAGGVAAFIDAEHAFDPSWAKRIGVDLEALLVSQPSHAEEALKIAELLVKSNAVDIIVIDSVAALVPKAEVDGSIGDSHVGIQARLMSQALRILTPQLSKSKCAIIFINQIRQKIGVMFGNPETTSGGLALKFYSSVRLEVRRGTQIKDGDQPIGTEVKFKVVKNKVAPPFRQTICELMFDRGLDTEADLINLGVEDKFVTKSGSHYSYGDTRLGQGMKNAKETLREHPEMIEEIKRKILEKRGLLEPKGDPEENGQAEASEEPATPKGRTRRQTPATSES